MAIATTQLLPHPAASRSKLKCPPRQHYWGWGYRNEPGGCRRLLCASKGAVGGLSINIVTALLQSIYLVRALAHIEHVL